MAVAQKVSLNLSLVFDVVVFFANYLFPIFLETFFLSGLLPVLACSINHKENAFISNIPDKIRQIQ